MARTDGFVTVLLAAGLASSLGACTFRSGGSEAQPPPPPPPASATAQPDAGAPAAQPTASADAQAPAAPAKSTAVTQKDSVKIPGNIVFDEAKATLKQGSGSEQVLEQLKLYLDENKQVTKLRIEGHTDNKGDPAANEKLSGERALTIKAWLVAHGVAAERLLAVGFGQNKPIADNKTDEGRAQNRRTEFKIAELYGKAYLGLAENGGGKEFK
ncbi:MAG TPA: OmpA family protein [Polyangiaceae bacterium]|jgi:OOP family OmpA-OmpF porin